MLAKCGYVCRSALKTAELVHRYFDLKNVECAISFGAPGGEVQYLQDVSNAFVYGVSLIGPDAIPFTNDIDSRRFEQLMGVDLDGEVLSKRNRDSIVQVVLDSDYTGVQFFGADLSNGAEENS